MHIKKNKFIILTNPRTGSELIARTLNHHPSVFCLGEIFSEGPDGTVWNNSEYKKLNKPFSFLEKHSTQSKKEIFGYKQISYWIKNIGFNNVEDFIRSSSAQGYKFIFITRDNLLKEYVSFVLMIERNYGHLSAKGTQTEQKFKIIYEEDTRKNQISVKPEIAYMTIRKWNSFNQKCLRIFRETDIQYLHLIYEQDIGSGKPGNNKIYDFLNIEKMVIDDPLKPTNPYKLNDLLLNYNEVIDYLKMHDKKQMVKYEK